QPVLLVARQARRTMIVGNLDEAGGGRIIAPSLVIEIAAVTLVAQAFLVASSGVRGEQDAPGLEAPGKLDKHPGKFLAWDVEQRGVGEDAIETICRQLQGEEILVQNFAARIGPCHGHEFLRSVQTDDIVTQRAKMAD